MTPLALHLLALAGILTPIVILLVGPDDALLRRAWQRRTPRTWHLETLIVGVAVGGVVIASGGEPIEWVGWAALLMAHGRNSIMAGCRRFALQ